MKSNQTISLINLCEYKLKLKVEEYTWNNKASFSINAYFLFELKSK